MSPGLLQMVVLWVSLKQSGALSRCRAVSNAYFYFSRVPQVCRAYQDHLAREVPGVLRVPTETLAYLAPQA